MLELRFYRLAVFAIAVGAMVVAVVSAQSGSPAPAPAATMEALLAEIKALRSDLNNRLDGSIRAQLLVARLQVQEQRINTIARQMTDIQQQLQNSERVRGPLEAQLKLFEAGQENSSEQEKKESEVAFVGPLRSQLELMVKSDEELKRQHLYLSGLIAEEQSRWTAFNTRLEELERLLDASSPPRR